MRTGNSVLWKKTDVEVFFKMPLNLGNGTNIGALRPTKLAVSIWRLNHEGFVRAGKAVAKATAAAEMKSATDADPHDFPEWSDLYELPYRNKIVGTPFVQGDLPESCASLTLRRTGYTGEYTLVSRWTETVDANRFQNGRGFRKIFSLKPRPLNSNRKRGGVKVLYADQQNVPSPDTYGVGDWPISNTHYFMTFEVQQQVDNNGNVDPDRQICAEVTRMEHKCVG